MLKCRILGLADNVTLEYKAHDQAIKDNSSFRNTEGASFPPLVPSLLEDNKQNISTPAANSQNVSSNSTAQSTSDSTITQ
jgi:hypothetical protein